MPRSIKMLTAAALLTLALFAAPAYAENPTSHSEEGHSLKQASAALTDMQKQELAGIYREMFAKKKQLIAKYLEFGLITQERASKWTDHLDARFAKLEKNGFIPDFRKCKDKRPD